MEFSGFSHFIHFVDVKIYLLSVFLCFESLSPFVMVIDSVSLSFASQGWEENNDKLQRFFSETCWIFVCCCFFFVSLSCIHVLWLEKSCVIKYVKWWISLTFLDIPVQHTFRECCSRCCFVFGSVFLLHVLLSSTWPHIHRITQGNGGVTVVVSIFVCCKSCRGKISYDTLQ